MNTNSSKNVVMLRCDDGGGFGIRKGQVKGIQLNLFSEQECSLLIQGCDAPVHVMHAATEVIEKLNQLN